MINPPPRPKISVIIPTLGTSPHLRGLLERLQRQKFTTSFNNSFEVIVVANIPQQGLRELVMSMQRSEDATFYYFETGRLGVNLARNKGLAHASGNIALFLDDDIILDSPLAQAEFFLQSYLDYHQRFPEAIAIGGPYVLVGQSTNWDRAYQFISSSWLNKYRLSHHRALRLLGGNLSLKLDRLRHVKEKFDEVLPYGGAETSLLQRLVEKHEEILFFEELSIGHAPTMSRQNFVRKAFLQGAGEAWREENVPVTPMVHAALFLQPSPPKDLTREISIYQHHFTYGKTVAPFNNELVHNSGLQFSEIHYFRFFLMNQVKLFFKTLLISAPRKLYSTTRSIWISSRYFV